MEIYDYKGQSLQSTYIESCGDYALFYLKDKARGQSMNNFLRRFSKDDYVDSDHKVGQLLKELIEKELLTYLLTYLSLSPQSGVKAVNKRPPELPILCLCF